MTNSGEVFFIDDSPMDLELAAAALTLLQAPLTHELCDSPERAIAALGARRPQDLPRIVFLDWKMAGFGGRDFLRGRAQRASLLSVPIVVLTSSAEPRDQALALELGATAFITKPTGFSEFVTLLEHAIEAWANKAKTPMLHDVA